MIGGLGVVLKLNVVYIVVEMVFICKVGGMGDVVIVFVCVI